MSYNLGQAVELTFTTSPAETGTLTVTRPDGTLATAVLSGVAGAQVALVDADQAGGWSYVWESANAGQQVGSFTVGVSVVTLAEVKARLFSGTVGTEYDAELTDLIDTAVEKVADMVGGPLTPTTVTETLPATGTVFLPATTTAVVSVLHGDTVVAADSYSLRHGLLTNAYWWSGDLTVTYTAGYAVTPARVRRAVLRYVKWQWSRDHGGSESYLPGGDDAAPGLGIDGIEKELRSILGDLVSMTRIA